jgi:hypothetical protein
METKMNIVVNDDPKLKQYNGTIGSTAKLVSEGVIHAY